MMRSATGGGGGGGEVRSSSFRTCCEVLPACTYAKTQAGTDEYSHVHVLCMFGHEYVHTTMPALYMDACLAHHVK